MRATSTARSTGRIARLHRLSLVVTIFVFIAVNAVATWVARGVREKNQDLLDNMFASIELLARIGRNLEQQRTVLEADTFEPAASETAALKQRLAAERADFAASARAYDPITTLPGENATWSDVKHDMIELGPAIDRVLELPLIQHDAEARTTIPALEARLNDAQAKLDRLREINRLGAERTIAVASARERLWLLFLALATAVGVAVSAAIGMFAARAGARLESELQELTEQLVHQNRELDAFAGRVAHDLRGPLQVIALAGDTLEKGGNPATHGILQRGVRRMSALIDDLLALSRIDSAAVDASCDPAAVVASIRDELAVKASAAGARLTVDVTPSSVRGSGGLLGQILMNLVDNSLKFHGERVPLTLAVIGRVAGDGYELSVTDNGVGMSPEEVGHAFEPFYRAGRTDAPGTGLGLAIVRRIVESFGATIAVESEVDRGTTMRIHLQGAFSSVPPALLGVAPFPNAPTVVKASSNIR